MQTYTEMLDYTEEAGEIIRGGRWPPAAGCITLTLTRTCDGDPLNWPAGADGWTWELLISRYVAGSAPDLTLTAHSVDLAGHILTLTFYATPVNSASLPGGGRKRFDVDLKSTDGSAVVSFYDGAQGWAHVRNAAGQG